MISCDISWSHNLSHDINWFHILSCGIMWYHHEISCDITWCHMISQDISWYHRISHEIIRYHVILRDILWYHMICHMMSHHMISQDITWCRMIPHYIACYKMISIYVYCRPVRGVFPMLPAPPPGCIHDIDSTWRKGYGCWKDHFVNIYLSGRLITYKSISILLWYHIQGKTNNTAEGHIYTMSATQRSSRVILHRRTSLQQLYIE